tara:strand:- start:84710 stop:85444 length:735 start_codon:yes stop_codon:yes gene_type:complete
MNHKEAMSVQFLEDAERYLNGAMTLPEKTAYDEKLNTDPAFRSQFEKTKALILGIESAVLKEQLDAFHNTMESETPVRALRQTNKSTYIWLGIAASIIAVLGIFLFFNKSTSTDQLFAAHFVPDPGLPTTMSTSGNYTFYDGMVNYKREEYTVAITKWKSLYTKKSDNDTLNYFLGMAQLANNNPEEAIVYLQEVLPQKESMFYNDVHYYLGLAYLKAGAVEKAKRAFQESKKAESNKILTELN